MKFPREYDNFSVFIVASIILHLVLLYLFPLGGLDGSGEPGADEREFEVVQYVELEYSEESMQAGIDDSRQQVENREKEELSREQGRQETSHPDWEQASGVEADSTADRKAAVEEQDSIHRTPSTDKPPVEKVGEDRAVSLLPPEHEGIAGTEIEGEEREFSQPSTAKSGEVASTTRTQVSEDNPEQRQSQAAATRDLPAETEETAEERLRPETRTDSQPVDNQNQFDTHPADRQETESAVQSPSSSVAGTQPEDKNGQISEDKSLPADEQQSVLKQPADGREPAGQLTEGPDDRVQTAVAPDQNRQQESSVTRAEPEQRLTRDRPSGQPDPEQDLNPKESRQFQEQPGVDRAVTDSNYPEQDRATLNNPPVAGRKAETETLIASLESEQSSPAVTDQDPLAGGGSPVGYRAVSGERPVDLSASDSWAGPAASRRESGTQPREPEQPAVEKQEPARERSVGRPELPDESKSAEPPSTAGRESEQKAGPRSPEVTDRESPRELLAGQTANLKSKTRESRPMTEFEQPAEEPGEVENRLQRESYRAQRSAETGAEPTTVQDLTQNQIESQTSEDRQTAAAGEQLEREAPASEEKEKAQGSPSPGRAPAEREPLPGPGELIGSSPDPVYPKYLVGQQVSGTVRLIVEVDSNGNLQQLRVVESAVSEEMDRNAKSTVDRNWEFKSYPLPYQMEITVEYYIDNDGNTRIRVSPRQLEFKE